MNYNDELSNKKDNRTPMKKWVKGLFKSSAVILAFALVFTCFSGCGIFKMKDNSSKTALTKIADNLYEITYKQDFDWGDTAMPDLSGFSCSGVQNGQYRGRNYDWMYADTDICVIHATVTEKRPHASVGVADLSFIDDGSGSYPLERIPFVTADGINDAGVCVQVNVIPYGENGVLSHTSTTADDIAGARVARYILDYADSVEDALSLLDGKDIYSELGTEEELHWMISGPTSKTDQTTKTIVVEVFPDGLHVTENFVGGKPIMTNFNVANFDGTIDSVGLGFGYERWQILSENYDQANSVMGTFDLMEKVYYSNLYDLYGDRFWYSEYNGTNLSDYYSAEELKNIIGEEKYNYYMENYGGVYYTSALYNGEKTINGDVAKTGILKAAAAYDAQAYTAQNKEDGSLWITVHTSVYDLENKTLDIQVRESQDHLHFTID